MVLTGLRNYGQSRQYRRHKRKEEKYRKEKKKEDGNNKKMMKCCFSDQLVYRYTNSNSVVLFV